MLYTPQQKHVGTCVILLCLSFIDQNLSSGAGDVDGAWSEWSSWTQCSKSCGGGVKVRERSCTNPPPKGNGKSCAGELEETGACSENPCPKREQ